ncbi:MAG: hypothetical protein U9Q81_12835 [Pseudomonadota bacterium]|nr:hypothetical protein [Pseudomonadota bacterium]
MNHIRRLTSGITGIPAAQERREHQCSTIQETSTWRFGIIRLGPAARIPPHDHPGAYAVSQVLAGQVTIDAFSLVKEYSRGMAQLRQASTADLGPGESAVLDPWDVNIHRLRASQHGAVLLTGAFANGASLRSRRWFFTIRQDQSGTIEAAAVDQAAIDSNSGARRLRLRAG